ncbi:hypothetical protein [Flavobacterium sp. HNIBRBA15423]|uniref:hypothetical protein n=1 Tax=Flavobacterium sp. HNIBRBA15423 TaxID=3458683 RepID=UPI004044A728
MIKILYLSTLCFLIANLCYSQKSKYIDVTFFDNKEIVTDVKYYQIKENKAYLMRLENSKLKIDYKEATGKELKLLARYNNKNIVFFIKPEDIYYLKISKKPFSFNNFCRKKYIINQGFDYEEIVKQSKNEYEFIE